MNNKFKLFKNNKLALISVVFIIAMIAVSISAPWLARFSYEEQNISRKLELPSRLHWLGTDVLGRDLFSRILYGARMSLSVGILSSVAALFVGISVGAIAGYRSGWIDRLIMGFVDLISIFPTLLLAILLMLIFGRGFVGIFVGLSATAWIPQARLVRGQMLLARELNYVEAARALGAGNFKIIVRHILPNLWGPIIVSLTLQIPANMMAESFLSFIGLGLQPPFSSWGTLANEGFRAMQSYPHLSIFPGAVLFLTLLAFNYLGDGLRDGLDPKKQLI